MGDLDEPGAQGGRAPLLRPCGPPKKFGRFLDFNGPKLPSQSSKSQDFGQIWTQKIQKKSLPTNIFFFKLHISHIWPSRGFWTQKKVENVNSFLKKKQNWALLFLDSEGSDSSRK